MPNKLLNIQNTYAYPINNKARAKAKANYNLVLAMQLLGIAPHAHIQPHTPKPKRPRAYNGRALETTKKPKLPGAWKGTNKNIKIGESFLKANGTPFTAIDQRALNLEIQLKKLLRSKRTTSQVNLGGNVNIERRKQAFEGKKSPKPKGRARSRPKPLRLLSPIKEEKPLLTSNVFARFEREASVPTNVSRSSRNGPGSSRNRRVVLTAR